MWSSHTYIWRTYFCSSFVANRAILRIMLTCEFPAWGWFTTFSRSAWGGWVQRDKHVCCSWKIKQRRGGWTKLYHTLVFYFAQLCITDIFSLAGKTKLWQVSVSFTTATTNKITTKTSKLIWPKNFQTKFFGLQIFFYQKIVYLYFLSGSPSSTFDFVCVCVSCVCHVCVVSPGWMRCSDRWS